MVLIEQADVWLFHAVNQKMVHPAADDLMVFLTTFRLSWPVFFFAALFILIRKGRAGALVILLALCAVGISDYTASGILKPLFQRVRPCFALEGCRLLVEQSHSFSFASSHAANAAAVAGTVWIYFYRNGPVADKLFSILLSLYAFFVAYSRVYVGVHYPADVLAGSIIGICSALLVYVIWSWLYKNVITLMIMRRELRP
ncbi:MAG: phosphatase PAP2 family protein [Chlorobiaceae bacterium]|jgi:undecaprenyl-diphosphatase|nr:phosphatase PAP2 family protein [Chlorobiaceae bacterium]NTW62548.1 phosphatase PAP2 family protein [Chlorobiaceae bacterium]